MESKTPFVILGNGPEARIAADIAHAADILIYGFLATDEEGYPEDIHDIVVIGRLDSDDARALLADETIIFGVAEKEIEKRRDLVEFVKNYKEVLGNLIHPTASVSPYARIGHGNICHAGFVLGSGSLFGSYNLVGSNVSIELDTIVGDYCTIQSGVKIGRGAEIGEGVFLGMGAIIHPGVTVGLGAMVADGAVVLRDIPEDATAFGNPAQVKN
ncbi:hypothetical protein N9933_03595 [bacterium]|nr:hypothetical protein [bacterium]